MNQYISNPDSYDRRKELDELCIPNKYIKNKVYFEDLKSVLVDFKAKIISENHSRNEGKVILLRQELTNKNQEIYSLNDRYSNELTELKKYNESQDNLRAERMKSLQMLIKIQYEKAVDKIKIFTKHSKWSGTIYSPYSLTFENLEDRLELVFRFMNDLVKDYDSIILFSDENLRNKSKLDQKGKELEEGYYKQKDELNKKLIEKESMIKELEKNLGQLIEQNKDKKKDDMIGQLEYEKQKLIDKLTIAEKNILNLKNARKSTT